MRRKHHPHEKQGDIQLEASLDNLEQAVLELVMGHLSIQDIFRLALINKYVYEVSKSETLWKYLYYRDFEEKDFGRAQREATNESFSWHKKYHETFNDGKRKQLEQYIDDQFISMDDDDFSGVSLKLTSDIKLAWRNDTSQKTTFNKLKKTWINRFKPIRILDLNQLLPEIILIILSFLSPKDIKQFSLTSKSNLPFFSDLVLKDKFKKCFPGKLAGAENRLNLLEETLKTLKNILAKEKLSLADKNPTFNIPQLKKEIVETEIKIALFWRTEFLETYNKVYLSFQTDSFLRTLFSKLLKKEFSMKDIFPLNHTNWTNLAAYALGRLTKIIYITGRLDILSALYEDGIRYYNECSPLETQGILLREWHFKLAIYCNNFDYLPELIAKLNYTNPEIFVAIKQPAVRAGNVEMLKYLFKLIPEHASLLKYESRPTSLYHAAADIDWDIANFLLKSGAEVDGKADLFTETPLYAAIKNYNKHPSYKREIPYDIVKLLVHYMVQQKSTRYSQVALSWAIENGNFNLLKILIEDGASEIFNGSEDTPQTSLNLALSQACVTAADEETYSNIAEFLIYHGANVNPEFGESPLTLAVLKYHLRLVKFLLEKGARINEDDVKKLLENKKLDVSVKFDAIVLILESNVCNQMDISIFLPYKKPILKAFERQLMKDEPQDKASRLSKVRSVENKLGQLSITSSYKSLTFTSLWKRVSTQKNNNKNNHLAVRAPNIN